MTKNISESRLHVGLKRNDPGVFKYLFDKYYTPLRYFAERLINDSAEAEDIISHTFVKFWKHCGNFETEANIRAFLYITVRNNCFNFLKSRQRLEKGKKELVAVLPSAEDLALSERFIIETGFLKVVHEHIQNLPEKCKEIFLLTYFEGMKANEIARLLNISVSTVTTQRSRALKYLRKVLPEKDFLLFLLLVACLNN